MTLQQHPLSAAFPAMSDEDFAALKDDIEVNGQREPVMIFEGMVLDGWHRYRACLDLGLKPQHFTFPEGDDPVAFVKGANLHRRHLTASQRAAAVVACAAWVPANIGRPRGAPGAPLGKGAPGAPFLTKAELAKEAHVSESTIAQAKVAHKAGLTDAVKSGAMTVKEAAAVARGKSAEPKKTALPSAPAPERGQTLPPAEDFGPTDAELAAQAREQEEEAAALRRLLEADDKLAALASENQQLRAEIRVLKERRDGLMNENAELVKRIKALQRKLDKLEQTA